MASWACFSVVTPISTSNVSQPASLVVVQFKIDYVNADGGIAHYYPDFLVKLSPKKMIVVETKGFEDLDVPLQMERLRQWC